MRFLYPLGLLGLIGIPIIILIYIIKNRYTEKMIATTYLWTLSEKFLKRRMPISKLVGIISLILQILAVLFISFGIAHPVFTLKDAAHSYCFILDASGSMNVEQDGQTRFDLGKAEIEKMVKAGANGSTYTLIYAGNVTNTVFEDYTDKDRVLQQLSELKVGYTASNLTEALEQAQEYMDGHDAVRAYLITDKTIEQTENVTVLQISDDGQNYALSDVKYERVEGGYKITGAVTSYEGAANLTVAIYFDGNEEAEATVELKKVPKQEKTPFSFTCEVDYFQNFRVAILEEDNLPLDSEIVVYNVEAENMSSVLIVSKTPFFISKGIISAGVPDKLVKVVSPDDYKGETGYGLYVFEGCAPDEMPDDGTVWFINPDKNVPGSNFTYQGEQVDDEKLIGKQNFTATFSTSTASAVRTLLKGATKRDFELANYVKCGLNGNFQTLVSCNGSPLIFAGTNTYGNREVIFAFDLKNATPFLLSGDYMTLLLNFVSYSFPTVLEETSYSCGDMLQVNVIAGCDSIRVLTPTGEEFFLDTSVDISEYELTAVGTYTIIMGMRDGSERTVNVFVELAEEERSLSASEEFFVLEYSGRDSIDGIYDLLLIAFIILAVVAVADWGVYCYEQYQLR